MKKVDQDTLDRIAKAFGFKDDYQEEGSDGPVVVLGKVQRGFIIQTPTDPLMTAPSRVVLQGGGTLKFREKWTDIKGGPWFQMQKRRFICWGSNFVAVDTFYGHPERVFLFPENPGFDIELIIQLLVAHRHHIEPARFVA